MKKRFLFVVFMFTLLITTPLIVLAENGGEGNTEPDFIVRAIHQEYKEGINDYPMVLVLKNNTNKSITVTGDENNQLTISLKTWPGAKEPEDFKFKLYREAKQIEIGAGKEETIVEVPTGAPGTWQAFYHSQLVRDMNVKIKIDGEKKEFPNVYYAIKGEMRNPLYVGQIKATDNEDGTATLKFTLTAFDEINDFVCDNTCPVRPEYRGMECCVNDVEPDKLGPKTGLEKKDFVMINMDGQVIGEIIQVKEIAEGEYEVVWQHEAGEYEGIKLNTAANYGDFYVCFFPKDSEGNYRVNESHLREYEFKATITHTKEPIVIKHDDATFETAGATNIPKLVELYFKEVKKEIDEESMNELEKIIQKTNVNKEIVHIYDISLLLDGEEIQPDGNVKITIPLDDQMKKYTDLKVVYISDTGEITEVESKITDNEISFITNHFSCYAILGTSKEDIPKSPQTGDSAIYYILSIGTMALMGMGILYKKRVY